jgi:hypothetical protein
VCFAATLVWLRRLPINTQASFQNSIVFFGQPRNLPLDKCHCGCKGEDIQCCWSQFVCCVCPCVFCPYVRGAIRNQVWEFSHRFSCRISFNASCSMQFEAATVGIFALTCQQRLSWHCFAFFLNTLNPCINLWLDRHTRLTSFSLTTFDHVLQVLPLVRCITGLKRVSESLPIYYWLLIVGRVKRRLYAQAIAEKKTGKWNRASQQGLSHPQPKIHVPQFIPQWALPLWTWPNIRFQASLAHPIISPGLLTLNMPIEWNNSRLLPSRQIRLVSYWDSQSSSTYHCGCPRISVNMKNNVSFYLSAINIAIEFAFKMLDCNKINGLVSFTQFNRE